MKRMAAVAAALAALAAAGGAAAETYYVAGANTRQISLVDGDGISTGADGVRRTTVVNVRREPQTMGVTFDWTRVDAEYDCAGKRMRLLSMTLYDRKGTALNVMPVDQPQWDPISPDTQGASILTFVCAAPSTYGELSTPMKGLGLQQVIDAIYDGEWPYDAMKAGRP